MIHAWASARRAMAKMKSGDVNSDRGSDEMREIEVAMDFTPNALASLIYRQGDTWCWHVPPKLTLCLDGFRGMLSEAGSTPSTHCYLARPIGDFGASAMVPRAGLRD